MIWSLKNIHKNGSSNKKYLEWNFNLSTPALLLLHQGLDKTMCIVYKN